MGYKYYVPFLSVFAKFGKTSISFVMSAGLSVRPYTWNYSAPAAGIFMNFDI